MRNTAAIRFLLVVLTAAAYSDTIRYGFVDFDDFDYVARNKMVAAGLTLEGVQWAFTTDRLGAAGAHASHTWHPTTWLSLMLDVEVYRWLGRLAPILSRILATTNTGLCPGGYHLTNVLLHAANVLLLFELLRSMTGAVWRSAMAAALLALHPLHVESVAWISERKDVLSMFFGLLTLHAYARYTRDPKLPRYLITATLFALGLMAKPMLVTLPLALLLLDYWPLRRNPHPGFLALMLEKAPMMALSAAASVVMIRLQRTNLLLADGVWIPIQVRLANAVVSYVQYLGKLFWPVDLAALYPNPSHIGRPFWSGWQVAGAAAVLFAITVGAVAQGRRRPYLIVGWLWYLGTMLPVIGLVQIGRHSIADRYTYIPFIGLYVAMVWGVADVTSAWRRRAAPLAVGASLVLAPCFVLTARQVRYWSDDLTLFEHGIAVTRNNWLFHNNAASTLEQRGRFDEAIDHVRAALVIYEECAWLHAHLGTLYQEQNRLDEAQRELELAMELKPDYSDGYFYLNAVLAQRRKTEHAVERLRSALEKNPDDVEARRALADALASLGRVDEAIEHLENVKQLRPAEARLLDELIAQLRSRKSPRSVRTTDPRTL